MGSARTGGDWRRCFPGDHRNHQAPQGYERPGRGRRDRHRAGPRDLRREEGGLGYLRSVITAVGPPRAGRSRRPHGQLCRDGSTSHRLRHAARSTSAAASAATMSPPAAPRFGTSLAGQFSKYRSLSAYSLLVGLEFPTGQFIAPASCPLGLGSAADHSGTRFHPGCLGRALEQALTLRLLIRAEIGVAGFMGYRRNRRARRAISAAASFLPHSRQQSNPSLARASELVPTPTIWHSVFHPPCRSLQPLLTVQTYPEWAGKISYRTLSCSAAFSSVSQPVVMPGTNALRASPSRTALPAGSCASIVTKAWVIFSTNAGSMSLCAVKQQ